MHANMRTVYGKGAKGPGTMRRDGAIKNLRKNPSGYIVQWEIKLTYLGFILSCRRASGVQVRLRHITHVAEAM